jgi:branched-subunit amino acid transport protein AzlD
MPNNILQSVLIIAVMAGVTALLRFIPFLIFRGKETPSFLLYLGKVLPHATIGMLIIFCLKNVSFLRFSFGIPELICILLTGVLHFWKRNTLLSILAGTISYMLLVQLVF